MEELIAKRYAKALSSVSKDIPGTVEVLNLLTQAIQTEEVKSALTSPLVSVAKKTELILSAVSDDDNILVNFIKVLGENKRLDLIPAIAKVLNADLQKELNQYEAVLKSSQELGEAELRKLEETLEIYTGSKIKLKQEQTDLDGLRVSVDDLGIEVNFSKQRVKEQLIDFINKSL
jgi:F-type H+-transporting ATPase subunit delta